MSRRLMEELLSGYDSVHMIAPLNHHFLLFDGFGPETRLLLAPLCVTTPPLPAAKITASATTVCMVQLARACYCCWRYRAIMVTYTVQLMLRSVFLCIVQFHSYYYRAVIGMIEQSQQVICASFCGANRSFRHSGHL